MTSRLKRVYLYVGIVFAFIGIVYLSYFNAKSTAETLVGPSKEYAQFSRVTFGVIDEKRIGWIFRFSNPTIFDAEFDIYVSVFGELVLTNPIDLEKRLRDMEKLEVHPYSKKGIKKRFGVPSE